jgi:hypothetical protein
MVRRLSAFLLIVPVALALASAANARTAAAAGGERGSVELQDGSGSVVLTLTRGALIGRFDRGRLRVTLGEGTQPQVVVFGADETIVVDETTTIYRGRHLRFKVLGGTWRVAIQATNIDASVVGLGMASLRGAAGLVSIDGGAFRQLPLEFRVIKLGDVSQEPATSGSEPQAPARDTGKEVPPAPSR